MFVDNRLLVLGRLWLEKIAMLWFVFISSGLILAASLVVVIWVGVNAVDAKKRFEQVYGKDL